MASSLVGLTVDSKETLGVVVLGDGRNRTLKQTEEQFLEAVDESGGNGGL